MTPEDFVSSLSVHFSTRHDTEEQSAQWLEHMLNALKGYQPKVLAKVAQDIIHERKSRSFPLIGEIREVAERHTPKRYDDAPKTYFGRSMRAPDSPEQLERYRLAKEWRDKVCASHGSVDEWLRATVHRRDDGAKGRVPAKRSTFNKLSTTSLRMTGEQPE
jgi:hypothetical protein